jgi:hypothetical protein
MGGSASSLLHKTDWKKADGKLTGPHDTVDGSAPTKEYGIVYLVKRGVNQREYDVTDSEMNLLFTTRAVPGTIACFDVLGRGIDEYVLRVTVDLARRYWIVYRYGSPSFEGQIPDAAESEKASNDHWDRNVDPNVQLYKKAVCIVSWSRYLVLAAFIGPPTVDMLMTCSAVDEGHTGGTEQHEVSEHEQEAEEAEDDLFRQASRIAERMRERAVSSDSNDLSLRSPLKSPLSPPVEADETIETQEEDEDDMPTDKKCRADSDGREKGLASLKQYLSKREAETPTILSVASMPEFRSPETSAKDDTGHETSSQLAKSAHNSPRAALLASTSVSAANIRMWFKKKSAHIREKSNAYLYSTPR